MAVHLVYFERNWQEVWALNTSVCSGGKTDDGPKLGMTSWMISGGATDPSKHMLLSETARDQYQSHTALPPVTAMTSNKGAALTGEIYISHKHLYIVVSSPNGFTFILMTETKHGGCQLFFSLSFHNNTLTLSAKQHSNTISVKSDMNTETTLLICCTNTIQMTFCKETLIHLRPQNAHGGVERWVIVLTMIIVSVNKNSLATIILLPTSAWLC